MSVYLWIAFGSALGGAARYWCNGFFARSLGGAFPWGTLFVNVAGCLFIGFFATLTAPDGRMFVAPLTRQVVMAGICGGFTTFSSFSLETLNLARDGEFFRASGNVMGSVALCLIGVWIGHLFGLYLNRLKGF